MQPQRPQQQSQNGPWNNDVLIYRATADEFHIPFDAMPPGKRDEFLHGSRHRILDRFATAMERQITRRRDSGLRVLPHPVRGVAIDFLDNDKLADVGATEWWGAIHLTDDVASVATFDLQVVPAAVGPRLGGQTQQVLEQGQHR